MPDAIITVKEFLSRIETEQSVKRDPIRVPALNELANDIGVSDKYFSKIVNNRANPYTRHIAAIIHALRRRGFDCDVEDLLRYVE